MHSCSPCCHFISFLILKAETRLTFFFFFEVTALPRWLTVWKYLLCSLFSPHAGWCYFAEATEAGPESEVKRAKRKESSQKAGGSGRPCRTRPRTTRWLNRSAKYCGNTGRRPTSRWLCEAKKHRKLQGMLAFNLKTTAGVELAF